jgi:hypothetical protein
MKNQGTTWVQSERKIQSNKSRGKLVSGNKIVLKAAEGFVPTSSQPVALCLPATANEVHCSLHELDKVFSDKLARLLIQPGAHKQHLD